MRNGLDGKVTLVINADTVLTPNMYVCSIRLQILFSQLKKTKILLS